jgi:hypothetical protein
MKPISTTFTIERVQAIAPYRAPGYENAILKIAQRNGDLLTLTEEQAAYIRLKYKRQAPLRIPGAETQSGIGLGDVVGAIATPIARLLNMNCIDPETKQLRPESDCQRRKEALNKLRI